MTVTDWITVIGIPSIVCGLVYIGGRLQVLSQLDSAMSKVKCNVSLIANALIGARFAGFDPDKLQAYSPLKITEHGDKFLDQIGFKTLFQSHSNEFFKCIDEEQPKTDYDIENAAIKCVFCLFDQPYFNKVKEYLYQHPNESKDDVIKVGGIYVRDRYMEQKRQTAA